MSTAKKLINDIKNNIGVTLTPPTPFYLKLVKTYPLQPITSEKKYDIAMRVVETLITYINATNEKDKGLDSYLKTLSGLVFEFEKSKIKPNIVSGGDMLAHLMDLHNLKQTDLAKELGGQSIVSKVLNNKVELNTKQISALAKRFKVSKSTFLS